MPEASHSLDSGNLFLWLPAGTGIEGIFRHTFDVISGGKDLPAFLVGDGYISDEDIGQIGTVLALGPLAGIEAQQRNFR